MCLLAYPLWSLALISIDFCRPCPETPRSSSHGESCSEIGEGREGEEQGSGGGLERRRAADQGAAHGRGGQAPEDCRQEGR
jgi:hypothetical protein